MPCHRRGARSLGLGLIACTGVAVLAACPAALLAAPSPIELLLNNTVPAGKKPSLTLIAKEPITGVTLEIERQEDHRSWKLKLGPLKVGERTELLIGDGKPGRARWQGRLVVRAGSGELTSGVNFESLIGAAGEGLKITYDRGHLDLERGHLEFQVSRPPGRAELVVIGDDGAELARVEQNLLGQRAATWLGIDWKPGATPVLRLELKVTADSGDVVHVRLVPWSVAIPHEEVVFASGDASIAAGETGKLDASYARITEAVEKVRKHEPGLDVRVYVAGHTDTVGRGEDNRRLSQARARAIATWFRERGLPLPLLYAGFGEEQPRVKTADEVDEARNRRADYLVGVEEPALGRGHYSPLK